MYDLLFVRQQLQTWPQRETWSVYMYVCVCVCVYIYIYIYTYMRNFTFTQPVRKQIAVVVTTGSNL